MPPSLPQPPAGQKKRVSVSSKLQALVYDVLPSTTAVFSYAIGSRKLSANEQFFVGAQTVVSLLQTTQIRQGVSFITANKVDTSTNKTTIVWIETELFFFSPGMDASHVDVRALALGCFHSPISTRTFRRALTASLHRQLRGGKECPFSGVTKSGRVWRKVPESGTRSVTQWLCLWWRLSIYLAFTRTPDGSYRRRLGSWL